MGPTYKGPSDACSEQPEWRKVTNGIGVSVWYHDLTKEYFLRVDFPTIAGKRAEKFFPRAALHQPSECLKDLLNAGAKLPGTIPQDELRKLLNTSDLPPQILTATPGWHRSTFVPAQKIVRLRGDTEQIRRIRVAPTAGRIAFGQCQGTADAWRSTVGVEISQSTMLSFAVMVAFAASLAELAELPEGILFNIFAESSSGKTTCSRVAMSVVGDPRQIASYHTSPRGFEEISAASNGYPMLVDDMEKIGDNPRAVLKHVNHIVTGGRSKRIAGNMNSQYPSLEWICYGLSTSPRRMTEIMQSAGQSPTLGDMVRFADIPLSLDNGGLFDLVGDGTLLDPEESLLRVRRIERGIALNHGILFEEWLGKVLRRVKSEHVSNGMDAFLRTVPPQSKAEGRLLRKFALAAVAGNLAVRFGILDWPRGHANTIVRRVWGWAKDELSKGQQRSAQPWLELHSALGDAHRVPKLETNAEFEGDVTQLVGVRRTRTGRDVVALRSGALSTIMGSEVEDLVNLLRLEGGLSTEAGRSDTSTSQVSIKIKSLVKPLRERCIIADSAALSKILAVKLGRPKQRRSPSSEDDGTV